MGDAPHLAHIERKERHAVVEQRFSLDDRPHAERCPDLLEQRDNGHRICRAHHGGEECSLQ